MIKYCLRVALLTGAVLHAAPGAWFNDSCVLAKLVETGKAFNAKDGTKQFPLKLGSCLDTLQSKTFSTVTKTVSTLKREFVLDSANNVEEEMKFSRSDIDVRHNNPSTCTYVASVIKTPSDSFNIDSLRAILSKVEKISEANEWRTKNNVYIQLSSAKPTCEIQASSRISRRRGHQVGYEIACTFYSDIFDESLNPCALNGLVREEKTSQVNRPNKLSNPKKH